MSNRYQTLSVVTGTVAAGATLDINSTGLPSLFDIDKIKITVDAAGGSFDYKIFKKDTFLAADLLAFWDDVSPSLFEPMDDSTGSPAEALEGPPIPYDDDDGTGELHHRILNNDGVGHVYTLSIKYVEVPVMTAAGGATFRDVVLAGNGTVSLPAFSFASDPDSGMYRIGANNIGFAVNGAKMVDITTAAVGINGTPTTGQLDVFGSGQNIANFRGTGATGGYISFYDTTNSISRGAIGWGSVIGAGASISDFIIDSVAALKFATNNSIVALTIDTSQNVGIGVTPTGNGKFELQNGLALFSSNATSGLSYIRGDSINFRYDANSQVQGSINNYGYANGTTQFRDLGINDGKGTSITYFKGDTHQALFADGTAGAPSVSSINQATTGLFFDSAPAFNGSVATVATFRVAASQFNFNKDVTFGWTDNASSGAGSLDVRLVRDAANVLALKNGTTAQELRVYGTTTGPVYLSLSDDGTNGYIRTNGASTLALGVNGTTYWAIDGANHDFRPNADNTTDLAESGVRIRSAYIGTSLNVGLATNATGDPIYLGSNGSNIVRLDRASSDVSPSGFDIRKARGTQASRSDVVSGDQIFDLTTYAWSTSYFATASIRTYVDGTFTSGQRPPSRIEFYTNAANGAQTLRQTIKNDGSLIFDGDASATFVFNEAGADIDFRIESDTNASHFISDAGAFSGVGAFGFGAAVSPADYIVMDFPALNALANASFHRVGMAASGAVTIPALTTSPHVATLYLDEPNITATGTVTHGTTLYIVGQPTEGTRNSAVNIALGSVVINDSGSALAQGATTGWLGIPGVATGKPNGTPVGHQAGCYPMFWDSVGKKISVWDGSAWVQTAALA